MRLTIRFILIFLIFNLTFVKEGHAALSNNDQATPLFFQLFSVSDEETKPRGITFNNDGSKMGKTADGSIWLDECKLSNYDFYQFWRNVDDKDVLRFLKLFTDLKVKDINNLKNKFINFIFIYYTRNTKNCNYFIFNELWC